MNEWMDDMMGYDTAEVKQGTEAGCPMFYGGHMYGYGSGVYLVLHAAIAISLVLFLLSLARWFWKGGSRK